MRALVLLPLLASSGCLYLDGRNHAPTISIADGITSTNRGGTLTVHPIVNDAEDGPKGVTVSYQMTLAGSSAPLDPQCDYNATTFGSDLSIRFFRAGIYEVTAIAEDSDQAKAQASVMVTISDAPPVFSPGAMIKQTSTRDYCNLNAGGDPITLKLDGSVTDADVTPADCPGAEMLTYTWSIADPLNTTATLTAFDGANCLKPDASSRGTLVAAAGAQVCLWTDPNVVGSSVMYDVTLDVYDGTTHVPSPMIGLNVSGDDSPCITGISPAAAGSYVVDRTQMQRFDVVGVVDDRDTLGMQLGLVWSVRRDSDAGWTQVPSWRGTSYELDPSSYGVGEIVHVRVEAIDRTCTNPATCTNLACPTSWPDCPTTSCITAPDVCHKWKTWDLELR